MKRESRVIRTSAGELVSYLEMAALPTAPGFAREQARVALRAWRLWPEAIETAGLLVSELVTNATKIANPEPGHLTYADLAGVECIAMTLRHAPGWVAIEVLGNSPKPPVLTEAEITADGGRGLMLVEALSKEWGISPWPLAARPSIASSAREERAMSDTCRAFWSRRQPAMVIVADPLGNVVAPLQVKAFAGRPLPVMLAGTGWACSPGESWAGDEDSPGEGLGEWPVAVFRHTQPLPTGSSGHVA